MAQKWTLEKTDEVTRRFKRWSKKNKRELAAVLANLDRLLTALNSGANLESIKFGFIHREPNGVIAIDQKGGGAGLSQARLYCYPHKGALVVHLITLGDKNSQKNQDIPFCKKFVLDLLKEDTELLKDENMAGTNNG
jgi:hypothetical protein